jgi:hypothetical protein
MPKDFVLRSTPESEGEKSSPFCKSDSSTKDTATIQLFYNWISFWSGSESVNVDESEFEVFTQPTTPAM